MISEKSGRAILLDIDDTLVARELPTRYGSQIFARVKKYSPLAEGADLLPEISREIVDGPLSTRERRSFERHRKRTVIPGIREILEEARSNGIELYGSTGRSNNRDWVEMTLETLDRGGLLHLLSDTFFTPEGVSTSMSKAVAMRNLSNDFEKVDHVDDDRHTVFALAGLFPDATIHLMQYGPRGLLYSAGELKQFPNVKRVASLKEVI